MTVESSTPLEPQSRFFGGKLREIGVVCPQSETAVLNKWVNAKSTCFFFLFFWLACSVFWLLVSLFSALLCISYDDY